MADSYFLTNITKCARLYVTETRRVLNADETDTKNVYLS